MNCIESRQTIDQLRPFEAPEGALKAHLSDCELCQHYYGERALEQQLASLQVPEPSSDFLERAMRHAVVEGESRETARRRRNWRWPSAIAASVLVAAAGLSTLKEAPIAPDVDQVVAVQPDEESYYREEVRIMIRSQQDWENAEVSVELAEDLELEGFAGEHLVSWNTKLTKGANMLTLPILVRKGGGEVRVTSHYGNKSHEVQVRVAPKDKSSSVFSRREDADA